VQRFGIACSGVQSTTDWVLKFSGVQKQETTKGRLLERDLLVVQKISYIEIMVVLLLLLLLLLAVDLEVETSRTPLLQMHTSSNTLLRR